MSYSPDVPIDIFVCYGKPRDALYPHWMLMGPGKPVDSPGIQSREYLGSIDPKFSKKITAAAHLVPAQQCQKYVVSLVAELEQRQLLPSGHAARLNRRVHMSATARGYAQKHPVPPPQINSLGMSTAHSSSPRGTRQIKPPRLKRVQNSIATIS
ncbi:hypothetical protein MGYG_06619 [Nannizzia gypsea CBS 118893]|uniref:Uncharacterized protein n=1 Tax=Arthroderma gypseum (strain ATCC MYA-4604 / CBS 118893) TaxID=535722 RepID=E4V2R3_ARTGP|nr:hypothetical protein MGYG_06619 [Nannizzia gypsea CBS 118893]EFR03625.1 hypothetical protein MGYG_06619 [Nannizzia gypsea CBS 118893]